MSEVLIEREILAYGPASTVTTIFTNVPVKPRSVKLFLDNGSASVYTAFDDGIGNLSGVGISGKIAYATGEVTLTVMPALTLAEHSVYVSYTYFSVAVTELNKVQYSSQDFQTNVESIKEFIRKNYPEDYNDFQNSSLGMCLIDIIAYSNHNLSWYLNRKMTDLYFPTAKTPSSVAKTARMLGYKARGAYSSQANLVVTLKDGPYAYPITIEKPFAFQGPNGLQFEYRNTVPVTFPAGEVTKSFDVMEGLSTTDNFISNGKTNQVFRLVKIPEGSFVEDGSIVVKVNGEEWTEYPVLPFNSVKAFEANIVSYPPTIKFGDGIQGQIPTDGYGIEVSYVICSGFSGRVIKDSITSVITPLNVNFNQIDLTILQPYASVGGDDPEDIRSITVNAPLFQKTQDRAITKGDYDYIGNNFPNVARSDAQIVRTVSQDYIIQGFFNELNNYVLTLKNSDRYLSPRPQKNRLFWDSQLFDQNVFTMKISGTSYSQAYTTSHHDTLVALGAQLETNTNIDNVSVDSTTHDLVITGKSDVVFSVTDLSMNGGSYAIATVTETSPAPNQIQTLVFDKDFFVGNRISLNYDSVPLSVSFGVDSATTLNQLAEAIRTFAKPPVAALQEVSSAPAQVTEISFSKELFHGCNVIARVTDLSQSTPVETEIRVPFRTNHSTTMTDLETAFEALSFVKSATKSGNKLTVETDSSKVQDIPNEILAYGNGTNPSFTGLQLLNVPVRLGSVKISAGSVTGNDGASAGMISGTGVSGSVNTNGIISLSFTVPPPLGTAIRVNYLYESSSVSLSFGEVTVSLNTVTVDEATRTIQIVTDSTGSLTLTDVTVTGRALPIPQQTLLQEMIAEDYGSVSAIGTSIKSQMNTLYAYLEKALSDGCRANSVVVSVLSKNADKKYAAPTQTILDSLWSYLDARKDIVHYVEVASGIDKVIDVDVDVEVLVNANSIEDEVVKKIERAILRSDVLPYGLMVEREFNASLYVSDFFTAIREYVDKSEIDHLNILIKGPAKHSTGLISDELVAIGTGDLSPLVVAINLTASPCVANEVKIYVDGVIVGQDNGTGIVNTVSGAGYTCVGQINYTSSELDLQINPNPPTGKQVTVTYYSSKLDERGNYICPKGYVLQAGTVVIRPLPRT